MTNKQPEEEVSFRCRAVNGDSFCGDRGHYWTTETSTTLCLVDGLGHGEHAEYAAKQSLAYVGDNLDMNLSDILYGCDKAIRDTRGVAMAIVAIRRQTQIIEFAGVGNIHGAFVGKKTNRLFSDPGIIGTGFKKVSIHTTNLADHKIVSLFTDGITNGAYQILSQLERGLDLEDVASEIEREHGNIKDDAGILLYRNRK